MTKNAYAAAALYLFLALFAIITFNTFYYSRVDRTADEFCEDSEKHDFLRLTDDRKNRFREMLRTETITYGDRPQNDTAFGGFRALIEREYPILFSDSRIEAKWLGYTLFFHMKPTVKEVSAKLPVLFLAHLDVVPAKEEEWNTRPFVPTDEDGFVYARGTIDNKNNVFNHLEALSYFLMDQSRPIERHIFIGFPDDEEGGDHTGPFSGAHRVKYEIQARGFETLDFVWDEGGAIVRGALPGLTVPAALIGVCEKSYLDLEVKITSAGGHSSMSTLDTSVVYQMSSVIKHLGDSQDEISPVYFDQGPENPFLTASIPKLKWFMRPVLANRWLFGGLIKKKFLAKGTTQALIRTVMGFTIIRAGIKNNVIPSEASLNINFRVHPLDTPKQIYERVKRVVARKFDFPVSIKNATDMIQEYGHNGCNMDQTTAGFAALKSNIQRIYKNEIIVTPYLTVGNTDARKFESMSKNVYRFSFFDYLVQDLNRFHGKNERILWTDLEKSMNFHYHMLEDVNKF